MLENSAHETDGSLFNRDFLLLWQGQLVSQIGDKAFSLGMIYWVMETTGSASLMGLLAMASALPALFLGPLGGTLADHHSRRRIIMISDLLCGLSMLILVGWMFQNPRNEGSSTLLLLAAATLFLSTMRSFFIPAINAALPDLVPRSQLARANALRQVSGGVVGALGQAIGGILYQMIGALQLFFFNGISFLISALSEFFIRLPEPPPRPRKSFRQAWHGYMTGTRLGLRYAWQRSGVPVLLLAAAASNFFFMPIFVLLPFYVDQVLGEPVTVYGYLMAAFTGGMLFGTSFAGWLKPNAEKRRRWMIASLYALSLSFALLAMTHSTSLAILSMLLVGFTSGIFNLLELTLFQLSTPNEMRGRMLGVVFAISRAVSPLGMALGGWLGDLTKKNIPLLYLCCAGATLCIASFAVSQKTFRELIALRV